MPLSATFTKIPEGSVPAIWDGQRLSATLAVEAEFEGTQSEIETGGYRQYVRGVFKADGQVVPHYLCNGEALSPSTFREDGCPAPACTALGYRRCPPVDNPLWVNQFLDGDTVDMRSGPTYKGQDSPGISGWPGLTLEMQLEYRVALVDVSTGKELDVRTWSVHGAAVVPTSIGSEGPTVMDSGRTLNAELTPDGAGGWNGSLAVSSGSGPAGPPAIRFQAEDANGTALGILRTERNVVQVGSPRSQTWVIRFGVARGQGTPDVLSGFLDEEAFTIKLVERHE